MKRTAKPVFFIVALLIFALTYTAFFGVYTHYGDRRDTIIRGAADIRFGIDIRGGVDVTFAPEDESIEVTADQMNDVRDVIVQRLIRNNITDHEAYADVANKQVIVRFPWKSDEADLPPRRLRSWARPLRSSSTSTGRKRMAFPPKSQAPRTWS